MRFSNYLVGLVIYLTFQSALAYLAGLGVWWILGLALAALLLSQILYLGVVAMMAQKEAMRRRESDASHDETSELGENAKSKVDAYSE